jgi:hypothetical protein
MPGALFEQEVRELTLVGESGLLREATELTER